MANNKLLIAAAGSWKTTFIVEESLRIKNDRILITTYTEANEEEIRKKFIEINGCIPWNVTVQTWFSFLLQHGVRPFQSVMHPSLDNINIWFILVEQQSWLRWYNRWKPFYWWEDNIIKHYFGKSKIYSDKISKFVCESNSKSDGAVISRIEKIFDHLFVDEVQDLAGWDLEILKALFESKISVLLAGDPRQVTYLTHHSTKHSKYRDWKIQDFIRNECKKIQFDIDTTTLGKSHRNCGVICTYSSNLFPALEPSTPCECKECCEKRGDDSEHSWIFIIKPEDIESYRAVYDPVILRDKEAICPEWNFGRSKWLTFDRVLIYPTGPMLSWMQNQKFDLKPMSRSKFYVALTRARKSVGIVVEADGSLDGFNVYSPIK